jgi:uncharacterized membrane protein
MTAATPAGSVPLNNEEPASSKRLAYIDWMRGLACVLMIQAHCYDSWLSADARKTALYRWSQELSTLAAPIFIFLAGVSFALVTERLRLKNTPEGQIFKTAIFRGAQIFGFGLLLRVQEFVLGYPKSPWTDLFRVDVLNILGISILLMAVFWRVTAARGDTGSQKPARSNHQLVVVHRGNHCPRHAAVVDYSSAAFPAMDAGVLYKWCAHF